MKNMISALSALALMSIGHLALAADSVSLDDLAGNYILADSSTATKACPTREALIRVRDAEVEIRAIGVYRHGSEAFDFVYGITGVNTQRFETIRFIAVTEIRRNVFKNGVLKTQSKSRSDFFPIPWVMISWNDYKTVLTVLSEGEILYGPETDACKMIRQ